MLKINPRSYSDVPDIHFTLTVKVDRTLCTNIPSDLAQRLSDIERDGFSTSLDALYLASAKMFQSADRTEKDLLQRVAHILQTWQLSVENGFLVTVPSKIEMERRDGSEIIGVGIGLLIAQRIYNLSLKFWNRTSKNARFDYVGEHSNASGTIAVSTFLEVRARLDRNNWGNAVKEAREKLDSKTEDGVSIEPDFMSRSAILTAPRSRLLQRAARTKDVLIMDPLNPNAKKPGQFAPLRALLHHYAPFFIQQGAYSRKWGERLQEIAHEDDETFALYLREGDEKLRYDERGLDKPWRTRLRYDGEEFCGTHFAGRALPFGWQGFQPTPGQGAFFFGVWKPVIEALRDGNLNEIAQMSVTEITTHYQNKLFVLQNDAVAMVWAMSEQDITTDMFDALFKSQSTLTTSPNGKESHEYAVALNTKEPVFTSNE